MMSGCRTLQIEPEAEPESSVEHDLVNVRATSGKQAAAAATSRLLLLHIREDLTYKQIAAKLKLTPRVVRRDIARAYAELRSDLGSPDLDAAQPLRKKAG